MAKKEIFVVTRYSTGRKHLLTKPLIEEIRRLMEVCSIENYIFKYLLIPETTWYRWKNEAAGLYEQYLEGKLPKPRSRQEHTKVQLLLQFSEALTRGRSQGVFRHSMAIVKAAEKGQWGAGKWWLQIIDPETFGDADTETRHHDVIDLEKIQRKVLARKNGNSRNEKSS